MCPQASIPVLMKVLSRIYFTGHLCNFDTLGNFLEYLQVVFLDCSDLELKIDIAGTVLPILSFKKNYQFNLYKTKFLNSEVL